MKKLILASYTSLFLVLFLGSCSVDKRLYRKGYHVDWNSSAKHTTAPDNSESVAKETEETVIEPAVTEESQVASVEPEVIVTAPELPATASTEKAPVVAEKKKGIISRIIKDDTKEDEDRIIAGSKAAAFKSGFKKGLKVLLPTVDEESHVFHLAIASFVLGIISLFSYYGAFVLGLLAIIFGAIAIHRIRMGGGYRGNTFAWLGLIFGIIAIAATVVIIRVY